MLNCRAGDCTGGSNPPLSEEQMNIVKTEKIKKIAGLLKNRIIYLPFVGWFLALIVYRGDDDFTIHHIKLSFALALTFTVCFIALGFILAFTRYGTINFVLVMVIYLAYLLYFATFVIGTRAVLHKKRVKFLLVGSYAERLNI